MQRPTVWLQVNIFEGDIRCPLCHMLMDRLGRHAVSCKAIGNTFQRHSAVQGGQRWVASRAPGSERPADVLLHTPRSLARLFERVALDFVVVSPFTVARASAASTHDVRLQAWLQAWGSSRLFRRCREGGRDTSPGKLDQGSVKKEPDNVGRKATEIGLNQLL